MIVFLAIAAYFIALFTIIEVAARKMPLSIEVSRKMAHILAGISAALLPLILSFMSIVVLALLFLMVMLVSRKRKIFRSIHDVERQSYGELFFPLAIAITALFFPDTATYMFGILVMAIGDGLAGLLGFRYGKKRYTLRKAHKSYLGSTIFFIASVLIGFIFLHSFMIVIIALMLTCIEAVSIRGFDNLLLPPVAALLMSLITIMKL
jgi:phytol kinase